MKKILSILFFLFCSIAAFSQQTMYWIGGAGNWSDLSHWSFQSGTQGPTQPSSIPTANTHVIFDSNSGLNGTGATTADLNARTVTLTAEVVIKSLTFDASMAASSPRISNGFNIRVEEYVTLQANVVFTTNTAAVTLEPTAGNTSVLTLNGGAIPFFAKGGAGDLNIIGTINSGRYYFNSGTSNYTATTARFAGNNSTSLYVQLTAIVNMPNLTLLETNGAVHFRNTSQFNAPLLTTWNDIAGSASNLTIAETVNLNLPALQVFNSRDIFMTSTASITLPALQTWNLRIFDASAATNTVTIANGAIVNATSWLYTGNVSSGTAEFNILNGSFTSKTGSIIEKVTIKNPYSLRSVITGNSTINKLIFENAGGFFASSMTVRQLTLAASVDYKFLINSIFTITQSLTDNTPSCTPNYLFYSVTSLESPITSTRANIRNNTGADITLNNATITNMNSNGTNGFLINGIDGGNNNGSFTFVEPPAKTIFWVGDANDGEWNNQANWSATSGGPGGYCLPTRYDDVIFDNNSVITGGSVKVTNISAEFHDITVQNNAPAFNFVRGGTVATAMLCYGSWYMRSGMVVATDNVQFRSTDLGETITSNGSFFRETYIYGTGGWTLQDAFQTQNGTAYDVYFRGGTLNTNSQNVYIGGNFMGNEAVSPTIARSLILGSSVVSVNRNWHYDHATCAVNAGTSHIILRSGNEFRALAGQTYYNVTSNILTTTSIEDIDFYGTNVNFNDVNIYNKTAVFINAGTNGNKISIMPVEPRANLYFGGNVTTNILEVQANGILRAANNVTITVNQNFVTHTADCTGLMEMYVNGKVAGQKFNFKSANNVTVPNVWMTGVNADLSTGATYNAYGLQDTDVTNWTFTTPAAKELYWIGVADNNWNNGLNWTTNSDGTPSAGGCVPTRYDNVHFNSFSTGNLPIKILDQPAFFNNLIGHPDAPVGLTITYDTPMEAYSYGDLIQMGPNMIFTSLTLAGSSASGQLINSGTSRFGNLTVQGTSPNWTFTNNMWVTGTYRQNAGTVTVNATSWTGSATVINGVALNLNVQTFTGGNTTFTKGALKASNLQMTLTGQFVSNSAVSTNTRSLDIRNSTISVGSLWYYYGLASNTLQAARSKITFGQDFIGQAGHQYDEIETGTNAAFAASAFYLRGGITANKVVFNQTKAILDNNTIGTLYLKPRGLTLFVQANSTQTVTEHLYISGTPCATNVVRAGTETGSTQASATATINYTNANPSVANDDNTFDYVRVGGINASNSKLFLQVNSTQLGLNTNVESIAGTPGLLGLGTNVTCMLINAAIPTTYTISADLFSAGPEATFVWYKKVNGTYQNLNLPLTTREIDVRNFLLDGDYKVDVLYDPNNPNVAFRCPQSDEITVSYIPDNVVAPNQVFCQIDNKKVSDLAIDATTQTYITTYGATLKWYNSLASTTALATTDILASGDYYASLTSSGGCESAARTKITVSIVANPTANAGPDQIAYNANLFTMAANNPAAGVGSWVVVSGNVTIANPSAYNTTITLNAGKTAELQWIVTNVCSVSDNVLLEIRNSIPRVNPSMRVRAGK